MQFKKKILHISTLHQYQDNRILHRECVTLADSYRVYFVVPHTHADTISNVHIEPIKRVENKWLRIFFSWVSLIKPLRKHRDAKVLHFHDPELIPFFLMYSFCTRAKIIYDAHENYPSNILDKTWVPVLLKNVFKLFAELMEWFADKRFAAIISVSDPILNRFTNANKTLIRNLPTVVEPFDRKPYSHSKNNFIQLAYVGVLAKERGLDILIPLLERIGGFRIVLAGWFVEKETEEIIRKSPLVDFKGVVSIDEVKKIYREADVGIHLLQPTRNAQVALPNKLFEFMEASLPFIISDLPEIRKVVRKYDCGLLVDPTNEKSIIMALNELKENPEKMYRMGINGRKAIENEYNWPYDALVLKNLYKRLVD